MRAIIDRPRRGGAAALGRALAEFGIVLGRETAGEHRAPCPECARRKPRHGDDALAVKVEAGGGATWRCHRCGGRGSLRPSGEPRGTPRRAAPPPTRPGPERRWRGLAAAARRWGGTGPI